MIRLWLVEVSQRVFDKEKQSGARSTPRCSSVHLTTTTTTTTTLTMIGGKALETRALTRRQQHRRSATQTPTATATRSCVHRTERKRNLLATCLCSNRNNDLEEKEEEEEEQRGGSKLGFVLSGALPDGMLSKALATFLALNISASGIPASSSPSLLNNVALADSRPEGVSVLESSTFKVSEDIRLPASIVKDCRTDSSGLQSVFWISSRSVGQNPTLYAVDKDGKILGSEYQVQVRNVGQEELVFVHRVRKNRQEDFMVLADTSNKFKNRDSLRFYEISPDVPSEVEDEKEKRDVSVKREISFEFPPAATPDDKDKGVSGLYKIPIGPTPAVELQYPQEDYDTAAIIVLDDTLWVFSKRSLGSSTALYRLPLETISPYTRAEDSSSYMLDFIQEFCSGAPVSGADVSSDGKRLAVMTSETIFLFDLTTPASETNPIANLLGRVSVPKTSGAPVGITWDDASTMIVLSDSNELTKITLSS